jgi:hypothetical protein
LLTLLSLLVASPAHAVEVAWNGHYRARGLLYDSQSLSRTNELAEGTSTLMDHRLRLIPSFFITPHVGVFAQVDYLPLTVWGDTPNTWYDPVTGESIPLAYADGVAPYASEDDGTSYLQNLQLTRAYADIYTSIGRFRFGRVPMQWGAGILFNDGLGVEQEFGDTSDRMQFTSRVGPVYLMGGWEIMDEGYIGETGDEMEAVDFALAYRSETVGIGLFNRFRFQPTQSFRAYTGDFWAMAELGPAKIQTEVVGVFGGGDLDTGANDVSIAAVGAMLQAEIELDRLMGGLEVGVATGDANPDDNDYRTFSFDRDHNVALMMFEEPFPVLAAQVPNETNQGRDYSVVRTGEGISNALYARPWIGWRFMPELAADVALFAAQAAKLPESEEANRGYGMEVDVSLRYDPYEHFWLKGTFGTFLPGPYYSNFEDEEFGGGFDATTFGARLFATVEF